MKKCKKLNEEVAAYYMSMSDPYDDNEILNHIDELTSTGMVFTYCEGKNRNNLKSCRDVYGMVPCIMSAVDGSHVEIREYKSRRCVFRENFVKLSGMWYFCGRGEFPYDLFE